MKIALPLMVLLSGSAALAQPAPSDATNPATATQPSSANDPAAAIANHLGLDAPTAGVVAQTVAKYRAQVEPIRQAEQQTVQALQQELAAAQPDPARLTQLENQLTSGRQQVESIDAQELAELQHELTPAQFGKLLLLHRPATRRGRISPQGAAGAPTATPTPSQ
jgi:hypothetical protein